MANNIMGQQEMYDAAYSGQIETIYQIIQQNPHILEIVDAVPFVNTPLHTAAYSGHVEFSIEIMRLKPSFGWKLNEQGYSPIHLALQNNHHKLVRYLVEINKDLVRVKGREGLTPLHFVCQSGDGEDNIRLLIYFLIVCPDSIKDVTVRSETALHIALLHDNLRAFQNLIYGLVKNKYSSGLQYYILNWKDSAENTILHIATIKNNEEAVDLLLIKMVDIKARNLNNQTALDIAQASPFTRIETTLSNFIAELERPDKPKSIVSRWYDGEIQMLVPKVSEEQRNAFMIVAGFILTAFYQAALSPVGGLTQGGCDNNGPNSKNLVKTTSSLNSTAPGKSVMSWNDFVGITLLNAFGFASSFSVILILMPKFPRPFYFFTCLSFILFSLSYLVSLSKIMP